jgi:isopropylmalate/homocitrate/citramalate synthase
MTVAQKTIFFHELIRCGFKEIEVAFPSASDTDFNFVRGLIEKHQVPEDVWLQVPCLRGAPSITITDWSFIKGLDTCSRGPHATYHRFSRWS